MEDSTRDRFVTALRAGHLSDPHFDALFPEPIRIAATHFWTPLSVARRAAEILTEVRALRVVDVGSGCGKFCLAAAAHAPELEVVGIEQRTHLVEAARSAASVLDLGNVKFLHGDSTSITADDFDALYLFNPFAENLFREGERLDATVELSERRFLADTLRMESVLARAPLGTLVITYHGFGGRFPDSFDVLHSERAGTNVLRVWAKARTHATRGRYFIEEDREVVVVRVRSSRAGV